MDTNNFPDSVEPESNYGYKTYSYNNNHNSQLPVDYWFQQPYEGLTLFVVFFTQACRWGRCLGCNLPSQMSQHPVSLANQVKQIDFIFEFGLSAQQKQELKKII